jgi:hypothetical protein
VARPGSEQSFVIFAGLAQERFSFIVEMKAFVLLARPEFVLQLRHCQLMHTVLLSVNVNFIHPEIVPRKFHSP